jgi:hypothetical protein
MLLFLDSCNLLFPFALEVLWKRGMAAPSGNLSFYLLTFSEFAHYLHNNTCFQMTTVYDGHYQ